MSTIPPPTASALSDGRREPPAAVPQGVWALAWPAIAGNLLFTAGGLIVFEAVGDLGARSIAAVTTGNQIFFALQALLMAIGAGTSALVARAWGAGDRDEALVVTVTSMVLAAIVGAVLTLPGIFFADQVAAVFGLDAETNALSGEFIRWLSAFNLVYAISMVFGSALRAVGDVWTPLWVGAITTALNLALIYALMYGHFGMPALGVAGAAIAQGLSALVGCALFAWLWTRQHLRLPWARIAWWQPARVRELIHVGYPAAVEQVVFRIGFFIFLAIVGHYYGAEAYAAYGIGIQLLSVCFVVGFGFSIAGSTLVGQHLGAGNPEAAARAAWRAFALALVTMSLLGVVAIAYAEPLALLMIDDPRVVEYSVAYTWILGLMMPLMAIEFAIGGALRGAGDTRSPLLATLLSLLVARCGLAALFTALDLSVLWVYGALVGDYLVKSAILLQRFRAGRWKSLVIGIPRI